MYPPYSVAAKPCAFCQHFHLGESKGCLLKHSLMDDVEPTLPKAIDLVTPDSRQHHYIERLSLLPLAHLKNEKFLTILSLGCGNVSEYKTFQALFPGKRIRYLGVDIDAHAINILKSNATSSDERYVIGDASNLDDIKKALWKAFAVHQVDLLIVRHPLIEFPAKDKHTKAAYQDIVSKFKIILTESPRLLLRPGHGVMIVSNHYVREFRRTVELLADLNTTPLYLLPESKDVPFATEPAPNLFREDLVWTLYSDRFMVAIISIQLKKSLGGPCLPKSPKSKPTRPLSYAPGYFGW